MEDIIEAMKRARIEHTSGSGRAKYPKALRRVAVGYWLAERERGRRSTEVARELGVHEVTLGTWRRELAGAKRVAQAEGTELPAIREVVVAECLPLTPRSSFVVHASCAVRIEGMNVTEAIELLRGLQ